MSKMSNQQAMDIIKAERECVLRQGKTGKCCRDEMGCGACDLVQKDVDIIEAYDMAIRALKEEMICPILSDDEVKQPCIKSPCGIERPHGEWVKRFDGNEWYWYCTSCKTQWYEEDLYMGGNEFPDFCPNCGADMRKEGDEK